MEEPPEEEAAEEEEEAEEDVPAAPYQPVYAPKNQMFFPPRGPGRPVLRQILSEPDLRKEFFGLPGDMGQLHETPAAAREHRKEFLELSYAQSQGHEDPVRRIEEHRRELANDLRRLDAQSKRRKENARRVAETHQAKEDMRNAHQRFLENSRSGKQRQAWTYCDPPGFFENPQRYEQGEAVTCSINKILTGIYDVNHPDYKPAHHECNVYGTWNNFTYNNRGDQLYEFRDKKFQQTPMGPTELKFQERLDRSIEMMTAASKKDALDQTTGYVKKQKIEAGVAPHSALKRGKPTLDSTGKPTFKSEPWRDQQVSTHTYFESPDKKITKPGESEYETGLPKYIVEADRAMSYKKGMFISTPSQKSFWNPPTKDMTGTNRRQAKAKELLHRNTRGATGLSPSAPDLTRPILLKGTGTLSFVHNKKALLQPPYERFSPGDTSLPP